MDWPPCFCPNQTMLLSSGEPHHVERRHFRTARRRHLLREAGLRFVWQYSPSVVDLTTPIWLTPMATSSTPNLPMSTATFFVVQLRRPTITSLAEQLPTPLFLTTPLSPPSFPMAPSSPSSSLTVPSVVLLLGYFRLRAYVLAQHHIVGDCWWLKASTEVVIPQA